MKVKHLSVLLIVVPWLLSSCQDLRLGEPAVEATLTMLALSTEVQATLDAASVEVEVSTVPAPATDLSLPTATATEPVSIETPTATATTSEPIARVNQNTNCRSGNGTIFKILYIALAGEELKVVAMTTLPDYVVVEVPDKPGQVCWLWTNYVELLGDQSSLPVRTPPPTPTPVVDFSVVYDYVDSCVGWDPSLKVENTGNVTFNSYNVEVNDTDTAVSQDHTADDFDKTGGCPIVQSIPQLNPGMTGWVYAYSFPYDPAGHSMQATVKLCTGAGLSGTCVTKNVNFTP